MDLAHDIILSTNQAEDTNMEESYMINTTEIKKHVIGGCCLADPPVIMNALAWNCQGLGSPSKF